MSAPPDHCPDCNCELYPVAHLRPRPAFTPTAKLLMTFGIVLGAVLYFCVLLVRSFYRVPIWGLALAGFPVAVLPALACAWLAYQLPQRMTLRCRRCGWSEQFWKK